MIPKLQLALDTTDFYDALKVTQQTAQFIDIIEIGTILGVCEGTNAIRSMKALFPNHIVLADVRIIKAGEIISREIFKNNADWISIVSDASLDTLSNTWKITQQMNKDLQIEFGEHWSWEDCTLWREMGISQVIYHRSSEVKEQEEEWGEKEFSIIRKLAEMGFKVSITGGVTKEEIPLFKDVPIFAFIAGRSIRKANNPTLAAKEFKDIILRTFNQ